MLKSALFGAKKVLRPVLTGAAIALTISLTSLTTPAFAEMISVTDMAGRTVSVSKGAKRVVLGEGRMMYSLALLNKEDPFGNIVGWKDDLIKFDPDAYRKYLARFPEAADIPNLGSPYAAEYSLEKLITLDADLVILNLGKLLQAQESGLLTKLQKAGIPTIFIDFRQRPTRNTVPSLLLLGKVLDRETQANEFVDYYIQQMSRVYAVVENMSEDDKPVVFIEQAAGYNPDKCCRTFGGENLGKLVDEAGGKNWGTTKFRGFSGAVNPEAIFVDDPEVIIGTGANWAEANPNTGAVLLGYEATAENVQVRLQALADRKGWGELKAVKTGKFFTIYHQFYNSPYHFVALHAFANWFHPKAFADLDPQVSFNELHERFLPIEASGVFWGQLGK